MNNEIVNYNPTRATLLQMRCDPVTFPRLNTIPKETAIEQMSLIVQQAFLYRGQEMNPDNIHFIAAAVIEEILTERQFGSDNLSMAEIQVIVKKAVLSGEMYGVSVATIYKAVTDYAKGEGHLHQVEADNQAREQRKEELKKSIIAPMLQAYAGEFIRNTKNTKQ